MERRAFVHAGLAAGLTGFATSATAITIEPVAEINWQKTRMTRLRVFIRKTAAGQVQHSHTFEVRLTAFF